MNLAPPSSPVPGAPVHAGWKGRLSAAAFYVGLAPLLWPFRFRRGDHFVQHHAAQALATVLLFLVVFAVDCVLFAGISYVLVYHRDLYERLPLPAGWAPPVRDMLILATVPLGWLIVWLGGLLLALSGSSRALPLVGQLARRPRLLRLAFAGNALLLAAAALTALTAIHASFLTRDDDDPAVAYLLYDDMGGVPRWVMNLGFYRVSLAARARWGPGRVVVAPLDERHLRLALLHGRLVYLAAHGDAGDITARDLQIAPPPLGNDGAGPARGLRVADAHGGGDPGRWTFLPAGKDLRFLYNSSCDGGSKAEEWRRALAPAEVRTFDRLSAVAEHLLWLWSEGPRRVRDME
jgi:uncharacterized membrane protein